jgi:hypothetical protein
VGEVRLPVEEKGKAEGLSHMKLKRLVRVQQQPAEEKVLKVEEAKVQKEEGEVKEEAKVQKEEDEVKEEVEVEVKVEEEEKEKVEVLL